MSSELSSDRTTELEVADHISIPFWSGEDAPLTMGAVADVEADVTMGGTSMAIDNDDAGLFIRSAGAVNADAVATRRAKTMVISVKFLIMFFVTFVSNTAVRILRSNRDSCYSSYLLASLTFLVQIGALAVGSSAR